MRIVQKVMKACFSCNWRFKKANIYLLFLFSVQGLQRSLVRSLTLFPQRSLCLSWPVRSPISCLWWSQSFWPTPWHKRSNRPSTTPSFASRSSHIYQSWGWDITSEFGLFFFCSHLKWLWILICFDFIYIFDLSLSITKLVTSLPSFRKYNIRVEDIMVRDVRFITLNSSYRDLQEMLLTGHLKTLALVECRGLFSLFIFLLLFFLVWNSGRLRQGRGL